MNLAAEFGQLKLTKDLQRKEIFFSIARLTNSDRLFLGGSDGRVYETEPLVEPAEFRELAGHASYVTGLVMANDQLISGGYDGNLIWWDREQRVPLRTVPAHAKWIRRVVASPDGSWVASVADDMVCRLWDTKTGALRLELKGHEARTPHHFPSMLFACAVSADGTKLATADKVGQVVVWNVETGVVLKRWEVPEMYTWDPKQRIHSIGGVRSLAFAPDGERLAVGGMGQVGNIDHLEGKSRVEVFQWQSGERSHTFAGEPKGLVERLVFHPQGNWLVAAGGDHAGFLQFFDLESSQMLKQEQAPAHIHDLAIHESGTRLYGAAHGRLLVWDILPPESAQAPSSPPS